MGRLHQFVTVCGVRESATYQRSFSQDYRAVVTDHHHLPLSEPCARFSRYPRALIPLPTIYRPRIESEEMEGDTPHVLGGGRELGSTGTSDLRPGSEQELKLEDPFCHGMEELPTARKERSRVVAYLEGSRQSPTNETTDPTLPLFRHLEQGLALTTGSALGSVAPSVEVCLSAFEVPNAALLMAGSRAWTKHAHRSRNVDEGEEEEATKRRKKSDGWWGSPSGPVSKINEKAIALFWKIIKSATWRNLHWLPHRVLVYEVRVAEGYGMRWSQDQGKDRSLPWVFRGFVEPMMENGHEVGWRHAVTL